MPNIALCVPRHQYDDVGDIDVGSIFSSIKKGVSSVGKAVGGAAKAVGKGVAAASRTVAKGSAIVGGALGHVPLVGSGLKGVYDLTIGAPYQVAANILSGQRIDRAVYNDLKSKLASVKAVAPYAQTVIALVPGVGPGVAGAIAGGLALASGQKLTDALLAATKGALPGGALAQSAFDIGKSAIQGQPLDKIALAALPLSAQQKQALQAGLSAAKAIAHGERVDHAILDNALKVLPPDAQKAIQIGMALGHGQVMQAVSAASQLNAVKQATGTVTNAVQGAASNAARQALSTVGANKMDLSKIGKQAKNIFGQVTNPLQAPIARRPVSIVSRDIQRVATALKHNPILATVPAGQLARMANVSPTTAARALQSGKYGLAWKPLSTLASHLVTRHSPYSSLRALTDTRGLSPDGMVYVVERGDYPGKIAKLLTGKESNWPQLISANPQKQTVNRGIGPEFKTLVAGEKLLIPASWRKPVAVATPGAAPSSDAPTVVVNDPARANTASILQAKGLLVTWSKTDGSKSAGLTDYGTRAEDLSATFGSRDQFAAKSFEQWSNAQRGTNLATDGVLNDALVSALRAWAEQRVAVPVTPMPPAQESAPASPGQTNPPSPSSPLPSLPLPTLPTTVPPLPTLELPPLGQAQQQPTQSAQSGDGTQPKGGLALALAGAVMGGLLFGIPGAVVGGGAGLVLDA